MAGRFSRAFWGSLPMSRAPVIPAASNSPSARGSSASWMCMSQRPGMRNRPLPMMTTAALGRRPPVGATEVILSP
jgi:hypothetical protein